MKNDNIAKKEYKKAKRTVNAIIAAISCVVSLSLTVLINYAFYHNYTVLRTSLAGIELPCSDSLIFSFAVGAFLLFFGLKLVFAKTMIMNRIPDNNKKEVAAIIDEDNNSFTEGDKPLYAGILLLVIAIVYIGCTSVNCFGYNDNSIRFSDSHKIIVTTGEYSDFDLYSLEGKWDDGKVILYGGNAYGIVSKDGKRSFDFGNVSDELATHLKQKYHTCKKAETIDEAINETQSTVK